MIVTKDAAKDGGEYKFNTRDRCDLLEDFARLDIGMKVFGVKTTWKLGAGVVFSAVGSIVASMMHKVF